MAMNRLTIPMLLLVLVLAGCASRTPEVPDPTPGDLERLQAAQTEALENAQTGQSVNWENPETGHRGSVTVLKTETEGDQPCRVVQRVFNAGDGFRSGRARACRLPDGSWTVERAEPLRTDAEAAWARDAELRMRYGNSFYWDPRYGMYRYGRPPWPYYDRPRGYRY